MKKRILLIGILILALGCSSETSEQPDHHDQESMESKLVKTNINPDISELCNIFIGIRKATDESGGNLNSFEDWEKRIVWTEKILQAAPQDYQEEAEVYLQLVIDREELVAAYNYARVNELPNEVRASFISEHIDQQLISNKLIEYATSNCFDE